MAKRLGINGRAVGRKQGVSLPGGGIIVPGQQPPPLRCLSDADGAPCCCPTGGEVCFSHYISCQSGFQDLSIRYPNGCPQVHPPVIYILAGDPNLRCFYFNGEIPQGVFPVLDPSEILAVFPDCDSCGPIQPPPTGSCCLPDGSCVTSTAAQCDNLQGTWTQGGSCTPNPCPPPVDPLGACCTPGGGCSDRTQAACAAVAGSVWHGPGSSCATTICQQPEQNSCCIAGQCFNLNETQCNQQGGTWFGAVPCGTVPCPPPQETGACCVNGECFSLTEQQCANVGGIWTGPPFSCASVECDFGFKPSGKEDWNVTMRSRGLGDSIAKFTHRTGIKAARESRIAQAVLGPCNCPERQAAANKMFAY